ncbi:MAG: patatin-like phospholipase family protein, partial [Elusimicrobiota bacterium]
MKQFFRKRKRGLAIGGGGVRSASAVGVLKYFQKHSIKFDFVSGTSMGAIVGALYCYHLSAEVVEKKIKETYESSFFSDLREEFKSNLQSKSDINEASIKERFTTYFSRLKLFR